MSGKIEIWGVKDPNISAQLALADQLDLFQREAGLDVSCTFLESGTTMPGDLLKAEIKPFAFTQTPITSILLHDKGFDTKLVAPLADIAGTQQIIIHESSGIAAPRDLAGKHVGMAQGAAVYMAIRNMAKDCNIDLESIEFVNLMPHDQLAAFGDEKLDVIACWEPWTSKAQTMGGNFYFSGSRSEIPDMEGDVNWLVNQSCLIVPDEHLQQQPDTVVEILRVLRKATDLLNTDRKHIAKILAEFFGISRFELMMAMQKNKYVMTMDSLFRIGVLGFRDFLYENNKVSQKFPEDIFYNPTFLEQVDPALVKLRTTASRGLTITEKDGVYYPSEIQLGRMDEPMNFLLADDSRYVRLSLARAVKMLGGQVVGEAATGREAIDQFNAFHPNFVTMDLSMPGVSGVDAISHILHADPSVNILVISGTDLDEMREEVFNLGAKIFITKPFDPEKVSTIIRSLAG